MERRLTSADLRIMKSEGKRIVMVTAYDSCTATLAEKASVDVLLVGDSVGMVMLGYASTVPVTVEDVLHHCRAVNRIATRALVVADMPFMSYHVSVEDAVRTAGRLVKEGGANAVKLEGGEEFSDAIKAIVRSKIPVMGHIGLGPQAAGIMGTYYVQGKTADEAGRLVRDAVAVEKAGAFAIVCELVAAEVTKMITEAVSVPVIGIGSGPHCDGQVLVTHDILGLYEGFKPKFVKRYAEIGRMIEVALKEFREEVRSGSFPGEENYFHMEPRELKKIRRVHLPTR